MRPWRSCRLPQDSLVRDDRTEARRGADELKGKRTGYSYDDLARLLRRAGCTVSGEGSSHRTWNHPRLPEHLTLKDDGAREVLTVYLVKTRKYLEQIAALSDD